MSNSANAATQTTIYRDRVEMPELELEVTQPDGVSQGHRLGLEALVIGSGSDADVVLVDDSVSRKHCELRMSSRGVEVSDLDSKNGTFVNAVRVGRALLEPGQILQVGRSRLTLTARAGRVSMPLTMDSQFGEASGVSVVMRAMFARLVRAAASEETVLLLGESGTGKELLARAIHERSKRSAGPFVVLDCSALAPTLVETELFGHARGAFTGALQVREGVFEQAGGGTVFIDEIGELPMDLQPKMLRALESREIRRLGENAVRPIDVRVIAATHRDIRGRAVSGEFRQDLYYRLAVVEAAVPPLRERKDDIPMLVERFLGERKPPMTLRDLPPNTLALLSAHDWPGNVRELRNTIARLVLFPEAPEAAIASLPRQGDATAALFSLTLGDARSEVVAQFEQSYLERKLAEHAGNVTHAAESAGVSRQFFHRLISRHGIDRE